MLKKLISFVTVLAVLLSAVNVFSQDGQQKIYNERRYELSKALLSQIADADMFLQDPQETFTRIRFTEGILRFMGIDENDSAEQIYNDVPKTMEGSGYVAAAYERGIISAADKFSPGEIITYPEALKMIMSLFDCQNAAQTCGGYPMGYQSVAQRLGVLKGTGYAVQAKITAADICILLRNFLLTHCMETESINNVNPDFSVTYETTEELNIEKYFSLTMSEGLITETAYSSMVLGTGINKGEYIGVNGNKYPGFYLGEEYLGKSAEVYFNENDEVCAVVEKDNTEESFALEDYDKIENGNIYYMNSANKKETRPLTQAYTVIYNGRRTETLTADMLKQKSGTVRLLDNDNDGKTDVVFFNEYLYGIVEGVDYTGGRMGIKNSLSINIDGEEVGFSCSNIDGETVKPYDIERGDAVAIKKSADGLLVNIVVLNKTVEGTLSAVGSDNIEIDGAVYKASEFLLKNDKDKLKLRSNLRVAIGINNEAAIVCDTNKEYVYGYVIKWEPVSRHLSSAIEMKMLTPNNTVEIYNLADTVKINKSSTKIKSVKSVLDTASFVRGIVRYALNKEGKIERMDLPKDASTPEAQTGDDVFVRNYAGVSGYYRSSPKAFVPYAAISSAVVFNVPSDVNADEKAYSVIQLSDIMGNTRHTTDLYDIDSYGNAGAAVLYDSDAANISYTSQSYIVKKVVSVINPDGETGTGIKCWSNSGMETLFIPDDVSLEKSAGGTVGMGDIIRIRKKNDKIEKVIVDIDMDTGVPVLNASSTAELNVTPANISYNTGYVYSCSDNSICLSDTQSSGLKVNPADMRYMFLSTAVKAVRLNLRDKELTPIDIGDIHSAVGYGSSGDFAIVRQTNDSTATIFIIE